MKFNIFFIIKGPAGELEIPNKYNPAETECLENLLRDLAVNLPIGPNNQLGLKITGIRIEEVK